MEGIYVSGCLNSVTGNIVTECEYGLILAGHYGHTLRENKMVNNTLNFGMINEEAIEMYNDVDPSNTVDGKPIYYWNNRRDAVVPLDAGMVVLVGCTNVTVKDLDLRKNLQGILVVPCHNCTILNNTVTENGKELMHPGSGGIILLWSSNVFIQENNITNNNVAGIDLSDS